MEEFWPRALGHLDRPTAAASATWPTVKGGVAALRSPTDVSDRSAEEDGGEDDLFSREQEALLQKATICIAFPAAPSEVRRILFGWGVAFVFLLPARRQRSSPRSRAQIRCSLQALFTSLCYCCRRRSSFFLCALFGFPPRLKLPEPGIDPGCGPLPLSCILWSFLLGFRSFTTGQEHSRVVEMLAAARRRVGIHLGFDWALCPLLSKGSCADVAVSHHLPFGVVVCRSPGRLCWGFGRLRFFCRRATRLPETRYFLPEIHHGSRLDAIRFKPTVL